jgi:hypothetical protein
MAIPTGPISLSQIKTEFGPNDPTAAPSLSSYKKYPGGTRVGATSLTTGVPTATPLNIRSFSGAATGYPTSSSTFSTGVAQSITIPSGVRIIKVEAWGGGGGGAGGTPAVLGPMCTPGKSGGGGGAGGYSQSTFNIVGPNWGQTMTYTVGTGGSGGTASGGAGTAGTTSTVVSNSYSIPSMTSNGGFGAPGITGGAGGTASGGTLFNYSGSAGASGVACGARSAGGTPVPSQVWPAPVTGGRGGCGGDSSGNAGYAGSVGRVLFTWTS